MENLPNKHYHCYIPFSRCSDNIQNPHHPSKPHSTDSTSQPHSYHHYSQTHTRKPPLIPYHRTLPSSSRSTQTPPLIPPLPRPSLHFPRHHNFPLFPIRTNLNHTLAVGFLIRRPFSISEHMGDKRTIDSSLQGECALLPLEGGGRVRTQVYS